MPQAVTSAQAQPCYSVSISPCSRQVTASLSCLSPALVLWKAEDDQGSRQPHHQQAHEWSLRWARELTYLHSARGLLLPDHVAPHTLEHFAVGEVGAVERFHVGV